MKIKQLLLAAALCATATTAVTAQDYPQNVVKLGLEGLTAAAIPLFPQINLHYERMITARQGANIMIGIGLPSTLSAADVANINARAEATATTANTSQVKIKSGSLSSFEVVGEYRFYVSDQEGPRGFYIAPQLYYKNFNGTLKGEHLPKGTNAKFAADEVQINLDMIDLGVQFGAQWLIADKVSIDWMILGIGGGVNSLSLSGKSDDTGKLDEWTVELKKSLGEDATAKAVGLSTASVLRSGDMIKVASPIFPLYFRTGLAVGYAF
jgi:hypothetical protein